MRSVLAKTFGGLTPQYYFRQFVFGMIFPVFAYIMLSQSPEKHPITLSTTAFFVVNTFLYPYARFVYDGVKNFILGDTVLVVNLVIMLMFSAFTMIMCWFFAIFIAPVGLVYLYFRNRRSA